MLIATHDGLILVLQSLFQILYSMQNLRKPRGREQCIYLGSKMCSRVGAIGTCNLVLSSKFILELERTFYIPKFSRNLISTSRLVPLGFS